MAVRAPKSRNVEDFETTTAATSLGETHTNTDSADLASSTTTNIGESGCEAFCTGGPFSFLDLWSSSNASARSERVRSPKLRTQWS